MKALNYFVACSALLLLPAVSVAEGPADSAEKKSRKHMQKKKIIPIDELITPSEMKDPSGKTILGAEKVISMSQVSSGSTDVLTIEYLQVGFFTNSTCTGLPLGGFYTTTTGSYTTTLGTSFGITAAGAWNIGTAQLNLDPSQMTDVTYMSIKMKGSGGTPTPQADFNGDTPKCIAVSCVGGSCTSTDSALTYQMKTPVVVGDNYDGGKVGCLGGGDNDFIVFKSDNAAAAWGGAHNTTDISPAPNSSTDGKTNTDRIVNKLREPGADPAYPAWICKGIRQTGGENDLGDWFVPAVDLTNGTGQMQCLYDNRNAIGGFDTSAGGYYWSSTQNTASPAGNANGMLFQSPGTRLSGGKSNSLKSRCIKKF